MKHHKYTRELLEPIVERCKTWAEVCRHFGVKPMTGAQTHIKSVANKFGISYSHFLGQASTRGKKFPRKRPIESYLVKDAVTESKNLRIRLLEEGLKKAVCEMCGLTEWLGEPLDLEMDHINSDHFDNRLGNLQLLCSNCHTVKTRKSRAARRKVAIAV